MILSIIEGKVFIHEGRETMEKHTPYFKVLDAFQQSSSCGLCLLEKDALRSYLEAFLYENVNDPKSRAILKASRGYCSSHTDELVGRHDVLALSILYRDQCLEADSFLEKNKKFKNQYKKWNQHEFCPACKQAQQIRKHYLGILIQGLQEEELRTAFLNHFQICMKHFLLITDQLQDSSFKKQIVQKMQMQLKFLAQELDQYCQDIQKNANGSLLDSPYHSSWKRAIEAVAGQPGVFIV
jgi:hypothetical protein